MSRSKYLSLLILIVLFTTACTRQSAAGGLATNVNVKLNIEPDPPVVGNSMIRLEVRDESGQPIEDLDIQIKGDMTHAGMAPVFGVSLYEGEGVYSIPFEWTMAGDWVLQVAADLPDGTLLNRSFEVQVAGE
jgi:hypothetical protein